MKKIITLLSISAALLLCSCAKDPIGGTNVQNVSGEWFVSAVLVDADGEEIDTYLEPGKHIHALTFNTNANDADSLILQVQDNDSEIDFGFGQGYTIVQDIVLHVDQASKTFSIKNAFYYEYDDETDVYADVTGSIVERGIKTKSGATADKIEITIALKDQDGANILEYFWNKYDFPSRYEGAVATGIKLIGWRYTGLTADEDETTPVDF